MRIATRVAGIVGATALGTMAMGSTAFADTVENDGVNVLDDNNLSVLPVQACGNNIGALVGVVVPVLSPQINECVNAPMEDHPSTDN